MRLVNHVLYRTEYTFMRRTRGLALHTEIETKLASLNLTDRRPTGLVGHMGKRRAPIGLALRSHRGIGTPSRGSGALPLWIST